MHDDTIRVVVRGYDVWTAIQIALGWVLVGSLVWELEASDPLMMAYFATLPIVLVAGALTVVTRWVAHVGPEGIDLVTEPIPLPLTGWSLSRSNIALVSMEEREDRGGGWGYGRRITSWGDHVRITYAVVVVDTAGDHHTLATEFSSAAEAKEVVDRVRRALRVEG